MTDSRYGLDPRENFMQEKNLMPIGRFSKCCRLSIKALRFYDEQELLKPAFVDPHTGYRYYNRHQARDAILIGMLRTIDIPIAVISALLKSEGKELQGILTREQTRIARDLAKMHQALHSIERIAREGHLMPYSIAVCEEPIYTVAKRSCVTNLENMLEDSATLVYALIDELKQVGRSYADPVMCINEDPDKQGSITVHACIGVKSPYPTLPHAHIIEIPGGPTAWLLHRGAYEELGIAYHALFAWIQERGHEQGGAMREIYLNDPAEVPADQLETRVLLPIRS